MYFCVNYFENEKSGFNFMLHNNNLESYFQHFVKELDKGTQRLIIIIII